MSDSNLTPDISSLAALSRQDRLRSLASSGLVRKWEEGDKADGVYVLDGEIRASGFDGWKTPFPQQLLSADGEVGSDAREVFLGQNRLLLDGDFLKSLAFLESQGEAIKHIRTLDLRFDELSEWTESKQVEGWRELATFVADKLNLAQLDLSLDAGNAFETYQEWQAEESNLSHIRDAYREIVEVLVNALKGRKPKSFAVYWAVFYEFEGEAERLVMGKDYDSAKSGKIPSNERNSFYPHGAPTKRLEWEGGMKLPSYST